MKKEIKNLIVGTLILITSFSLTAFTSNEKSRTEENKKVNGKEVTLTSDCNYGQCNAVAKSTGRRCLHCVSNAGDLYCYQH